MLQIFSSACLLMLNAIYLHMNYFLVSIGPICDSFKRFQDSWCIWNLVAQKNPLMQLPSKHCPLASMHSCQHFFKCSKYFWLHLQLVPRSRKRGSIHPLPYILSWRSAYLVKYRGNFTNFCHHVQYNNTMSKNMYLNLSCQSEPSTVTSKIQRGKNHMQQD
jgi:hypothetical protein